ncbi:MAG: MATE family efflux transporter [Deltaproteobacteria bacterium]|nr:MATE family efflux transporter [Deltaproteobacteria bacterium]MBW2415461.1 MATE family efflux transporter [Deltaproteobacteria bacterium]
MTPFRREVRALTRISLPVVATQVGNMTMGVVDTLMVSRIGFEALAAAALGNACVWGTLMFVQGAVMGIDPFVSQAHGARDGDRAALALQHGLVVAVLASLPVAALWLFTEDFLILARQSPELARVAHDYVRVQIPSIPLFAAFLALRQYLQGRTIVLPAMWVMLLANVFNAFANWVLIFGKLGFPELGVLGAGIATSLNRGFVLVALVVWVAVFRLHRGAWRPWDRAAFDPRGIARVLRIGIPVAITLSLEAWAFQVSMLMAGTLGAATLAAHSVVMNVISFIFMVPLGISIGASTRVGNLIGAQDGAGARVASTVAFAMGALVMTGSAALLFGLRGQLPLLYTSEAGVVATAALIFPVAAAFQLFDGVQVVGCGILRGMGRTHAAAWSNVVGYYGLALPLAWWLTFQRGLGIVGVWWGLAAGLATVACFLVVWVYRAGPPRPVPA